MLSDPLRSALIRDYENQTERDLIRALLELRVSDEDLWHAFDEGKLKAVLHEPAKEADLRRPVKNYLRDEWGLVGIAAEVPLGSKSARSASKADIVGYKTGILGGSQFYGVELKSSPTKGAIRQALLSLRSISNTAISQLRASPLWSTSATSMISTRNSRIPNTKESVFGSRRLKRSCTSFGKPL